jgi:hypothetical protein
MLEHVACGPRHFRFPNFHKFPMVLILFAEGRLREKQTPEAGAKRALEEAAKHLLMVRDRGILRTSELVGRLKNRKELVANAVSDRIDGQSFKAVAFLSKELSARPKHGLNLPNSDISGLSIDCIVA